MVGSGVDPRKDNFGGVIDGGRGGLILLFPGSYGARRSFPNLRGLEATRGGSMFSLLDPGSDRRPRIAALIVVMGAVIWLSDLSLRPVGWEGLTRLQSSLSIFVLQSP